MADPYVEITFTFEGGDAKTLDMSLENYKKLKTDIQVNRRPGSEATVTLAIADANGVGGEFVLPWAKVIYAEAFLRGEPDVQAVAQQLLAGPDNPPPAS
jgi:hypothetical protein